MGPDSAASRQACDHLIHGQHQSICQAIQAFLQAASLQELHQCLDRLRRHVQAHFEYEETVMRQLHFADYREHVQSHDQLLGRLDRLHQRMSGDALDRMEMQVFLKHWTLAHMPFADARLSEFLNSSALDSAFL